MRVLLLVTVLLAAGCCTSNERAVFVETSLARLELPERPTRVVRLSGGGSGSVWYTLSPDHTSTIIPSVEQSRVDSEDPGGTCDDAWEDTLFGRIDVCLAKRVSVGYSRRNDGAPMGHAILYLAGPERERAKAGDFSLAVSGAWGRDEESFTSTSNGDRYHTRVERHERDFSLIAGLRVANWMMFYGGPYRLKTGFHIEHERPNLRTTSSGDITASGWHVGVGLFAGRHSSWLIEYSGADVQAGTEEPSEEHMSFRYQLEFWGRPPPPRKKPRPSGQVGSG